MDQVKLAKLLMLTTSDSDGEALNAVRAANVILKKAKKNWEEVFKDQKESPKEKTHQSWYDRVRPLDPEIIHMLEYCLERLSGSGYQFIKSLNTQYRLRRSLSTKQLEALRKWYANL